MKDYDIFLERYRLAHGRLGYYKKAMKDFDRAIELNPKDARAYYNRGLAYGMLGNDDQAIKDYGMAIDLNPKYADAYCNRGTAYHNLGNYNQATNDLRIAARLGNQGAQDFLRQKGVEW